jgi:hypothetical protein
MGPQQATNDILGVDRPSLPGRDVVEDGRVPTRPARQRLEAFGGKLVVVSPGEAQPAYQYIGPVVTTV